MSDSQAVDPQRYPQSAKLIAQESFKSSQRPKCRDTGSSSCCCLASDCFSGGQACQRTKRRCYCITWPGATNLRCLYAAAVPARQGKKRRQTGRRQHNSQFQCSWHSCPCECFPPATPCACTEALQGDVQKSYDGAIQIPVYLLNVEEWICCFRGCMPLILCISALQGWAKKAAHLNKELSGPDTSILGTPQPDPCASRLRHTPQVTISSQ